MTISPELLEQTSWVVEDLFQDKDLYYISKVTTPTDVVMDIFYEDEDTEEIIKLSGEEAYFLDTEGYYRRLIKKDLYNETDEQELIKKTLFTKADRELMRNRYFSKETKSLL
jgi:hypothetical protein